LADALTVGAILRVPDDRIGETVVDELFDAATAAEYARTHPVAARCERIVGRDPGDNLIVVAGGVFCYWEHETDRLIPLGENPDHFVALVPS